MLRLTPYTPSGQPADAANKSVPFRAIITGMHTSASTSVAIAAAILAAMAVSCGSRTPTAPAGGGQVHTIIATVMLESTGPNPREMTIAVGETVSFMNRSEEHTSELQSPCNLVCRLLLEKKKR